MNRLRKLGVGLIAAVAVLLMFSSHAYAARSGSYSCKSDKQLDSAKDFTIAVQSAGRVHVHAYGGSDKSGVVYPYMWKLYDASGKQVDFFPEGLLVFVSPNMLNETNLEGLVPGMAYTIELVSQDFCANMKAVRHSVTMPQAASELNLPALSKPTLVQFWGSASTELQFSVTDDTGVQSVEVYINGNLVSSDRYVGGASFRWWCDNYAADNAKSTLEGPCYYISYPDSYRGQYCLVMVVVADYFGNTSTTSAYYVL